MPTTGNHKSSLLGAMVIFIFLSVALTVLTTTEFGHHKNFQLALGIVALVTALICLVEARRHRPPPAGSKMSWRLEDLDLASILLWGFVAAVSFCNFAGVSLLRPDWH